MTTIDGSRALAYDVRTDEMLVNMGPQHPSTHGVLRLLLRTDGEIVSWIEPHIGYLHRCAEKIGENLAPRQWVPYTDRMDYLAGMNMNLGWALVVERLLGLTVCDKVRHLRVIAAELNRIASHLVGMGTYGLDLGSFTPFLYAFREREKILDLFEALCGARLTYSYIVPGGVTSDLPGGWRDKCARFLDELWPIIDDYHTLLTSNAIFIKRTAGIGVLPAPLAIEYGCTGPVLRGSGVDQDLRRDGAPCYTSMYRDYHFHVIVQRDGHYPQDHAYPPVPSEAVLGDAWHRYYVRMLELVQSVDLVRQGLANYQAADDQWSAPIKLTQRLPEGEAYLETEAPKGQMGFYLVSDGSVIPWRVRARSSCFANLSVAPELCRGCLLADIPAIVGSLDLVMGEIDR